MFKDVARKIWISQRDALEGWDGFDHSINQLDEDKLTLLDAEMIGIVERHLSRMMSKMFGNER